MTILEKAHKYGREVVFDKLQKADIQEYGIYHGPLVQKIQTIKEEYCREDGPMLVAGGLNNNDFRHMLLKILQDTPDKVLQGLAILSWLMEASEMLLYIPEGEESLKQQVMKTAQELKIDVDIRTQIVDMRLMSNGCICHIETLYMIAEAVNDTYVPGTWVNIQKISDSGCTKLREAEYIKFGTKIGYLIDIDTNDIKAVHIGSKLYDASVLEKEITPELVLGDGVITIYDKSCCMIAKAEKALLEGRKKSCGKCTFCREGLNQLFVRTSEITKGKGELNALKIMGEIGETMKFSTLCSIGQYGSTFTLDTMRLFSNEYEDHIKKKKCTAGVCPDFINVYINPAKCEGCGICIGNCPVNCIEGLPGYIHMIEDIDCTKCGKCIEFCEAGAIIKTTEKVPGLPDRLTRIGRFKRY
ncbi:MAG TPA: NADH-ubiquinone oxidoreductase-F iron-sulfur binding region domain-containing protein [Clostridia bacterium]|nr:NADH-ubiquinone oxidoreductase-F iron-sulfur binding region domain-containing protein [Clostridia bacterium]